jgi:hypothetical protein
MPKEYSNQPLTAHSPAVWHVCCKALTVVKPDIFSIYENTQSLAVHYHILLWFFCRGDESVILFQVNNNNIAMPQSAKTSSVMYKQQVIVKPHAPKQMRNKSILCKPYMHTKGVSCRPHPCTKETQTGDKSILLSCSFICMDWVHEMLTFIVGVYHGCLRNAPVHIFV